MTARVASVPLSRVLDRLDGVRGTGGGYVARCPAHDDGHASLSVKGGNDGRVLLHCHAGCEPAAVVAALDLDLRDLFAHEGGEGGRFPPSTPAHPHTPPALDSGTDADTPGLDLAAYAATKAFPVDALREYGLSDLHYMGKPALRIAYRDTGGVEVAVRFRIRMEGDRFRWRKGDKPTLYGLERLAAVREAGYAALVEGESDCHASWYHGIPAVGIPGAANWREERDALHLDDIPVIYLVVEPDTGGEAVLKWLAKSRIAPRVRLVRLSETAGVKDLSALHLDDPDAFRDRLQAALEAAEPYAAYVAREVDEAAREAWAVCSALAREGDILAEFVKVARRRGLVGEDRNAAILFLALVSRLLPRPVSIAVKGPSSGGKSFTVQSTLNFFPAAAFYALTAMSERALAYSDEPLVHRFLVIYEAAGMAGDMATYFMRSLLSKGCIRYETVEKTKDGMKPRLVERDGPTGLIVTTTAAKLHPENETRLLSLTVTDTRAQTAAVFRALAADSEPGDDHYGCDDTGDLAPWHALQVWLEGGERRVAIPYADALAAGVPPIATRLRRDFTALLTLVRAHALLHQATRERDDRGRIVATVEDYAAVRELVHDLVAEGVEATVPPTMRETVETVRALTTAADSTTTAKVAAHLALDRSTATRRIAVAIERGYVKNLEPGRGKAALLVLGDALPADAEVLPSAEQLREARVCSDAGVRGGIDTPPPPLDALDRQRLRNWCEQVQDGTTDVLPTGVQMVAVRHGMPPGSEEGIGAFAERLTAWLQERGREAA